MTVKSSHPLPVYGSPYPTPLLDSRRGNRKGKKYASLKSGYLHLTFLLQQSHWQQEGKTCLMSCVLDSPSPSRTPDPSILYKGEKGQSLQDSVFLWYFQSNSQASFNSFGLWDVLWTSPHDQWWSDAQSLFQSFGRTTGLELHFNSNTLLPSRVFYSSTRILNTHTQTSLTQKFNTMWKEQS